MTQTDHITELFREGQNSRLEEMTCNIDADLKQVLMIRLPINILFNIFLGSQ